MQARKSRRRGRRLARRRMRTMKPSPCSCHRLLASQRRHTNAHTPQTLAIAVHIRILLVCVRVFVLFFLLALIRLPADALCLRWADPRPGEAVASVWCPKRLVDAAWRRDGEGERNPVPRPRRRDPHHAPRGGGPYRPRREAHLPGPSLLFFSLGTRPSPFFPQCTSRFLLS